MYFIQHRDVKSNKYIKKRVFMPKKISKINTWQKNYNVLEELGEGGNGKVYCVQKIDNGEIYALKQLEFYSTEKKSRFQREIVVVRQYASEIKGVLPIIEYSNEEFWYTMPIAKPIMDFIKEETAEISNIIEAVLQLSETLEQLHEKDISHRDIKPSNMYYLDGRYCLADFGLVSYPEETDKLTHSDKWLGAIFTISPEMKRDPKNANGKKADVFSFAKTVWMLFTGDERGFDGVYNFQDKSHGLRYHSKFKNMHIVELEELLTNATQNDPAERPTMSEFRENFLQWVRIFNDYDESLKREWAFLKRNLFGVDYPETASWSDPICITNVLNFIGATPSCNHMMLPGGGGMDLMSAERAAENECIYLYDDFGGCHLVCPRRLYYVAIDDDTDWSYFFLELVELPTILGETSLCYESLVEDAPGHYVSAQYVQYGVYDYDTGEALPDGYRKVFRYNYGNILIVFKRSPYNKISSTYDGRHSSIDFREFSDYMESLRKNYYYLLDKGARPEQILSAPQFCRNPFSRVKQEALPNYEYIQTKQARKYIEESYSLWNFSDLLLRSKTFGNAAFYIELRINSYDILELFFQESIILCTDGYFRTVKKEEIEMSAFLLYDRKECFNLLNKCEKKLGELCEKQGVVPPMDETYFYVVIQPLAIPEHLFTKEEIKDLMKNADDRIRNGLVIDENGYANIISDFRQANSYPVRLESWDAGNCYVGRYSHLLSLEDTYLQALEGWLYYLKYGQRSYIDFSSGHLTSEDLVSQIYKIKSNK